MVVYVSASLASLTRETGPKVVRGDPAGKADGRKAVHVEHHLYDSSLFGLSDSALKFTHILYNLSPAGTLLNFTCMSTLFRSILRLCLEIFKMRILGCVRNYKFLLES